MDPRWIWSSASHWLLAQINLPEPQWPNMENGDNSVHQRVIVKVKGNDANEKLGPLCRAHSTCSINTNSEGPNDPLLANLSQ